MNQLMRVENGEVKMDSRMIAEHFGKNHKDVMRDIRDEIEKLESAGMGDERIFAPIEYPDGRNRKQPAYEMNEEGAMQLAARYDAVARRQLILKIKELKQTALAPKTPAEMLAMMAQQAVEQEKKLVALEGTVQVIKDAMVPDDTAWKANITKKINRIVAAIGGDKNAHLQIRKESYDALERKAHANLETRVTNLQDRLRRTGATAKAIREANKLEVIEQDPKLREIYSGIVEKMVIKYC